MKVKMRNRILIPIFMVVVIFYMGFYADTGGADTSRLTVIDGYDARLRLGDTLENLGTTYLVQASDDNRLEIKEARYISFEFSDIPPGAIVTSVIIYVEHYESRTFPFTWKVGTGWPDEAVWDTNSSIQVRTADYTDSWDVSSAVNTVSKLNNMELAIYNQGSFTRGKWGTERIYVDYVYAEVTYSLVPGPDIDNSGL